MYVMIYDKCALHTAQGQVTSLQMDLVELEVRRAREAEKVSRNDGDSHDDGEGGSIQ